MTFAAQQKAPLLAGLADPAVDLSSTRAPIYVQLMTLFRRFIVRSQWPVGHRIPTHDALALQFGVNPATVRKAIETLAAEGLVSCSRRRGTFVIAKPPNAKWHDIATTWKGVLHAYDDLPSKLLEEREVKAILPRTPATDGPPRRYRYARRLYRRGNMPLIVEDSYLGETVYKKLCKSALRTVAPIRLVARHTRVKRADQTVRFGIADGEISNLLDVPLNAPLAIVRLSIGDEDSACCFESTAYIRGDTVRLIEPISFEENRLRCR
jgi:GntR family transcriptional regulator